jgi:iron-sulfur cluster assembly protein
MSTITDTAATPVSFTAGAIQEIERLMHAPDFDQQQRLRVGVKGGGCIETSHQIYLYGMQIDWQGGLNSRGFTFTNPNASSTCGCGTSFAV